MSFAGNFDRSYILRNIIVCVLLPLRRGTWTKLLSQSSLTLSIARYEALHCGPLDFLHSSIASLGTCILNSRANASAHACRPARCVQFTRAPSLDWGGGAEASCQFVRLRGLRSKSLGRFLCAISRTARLFVTGKAHLFSPPRKGTGGDVLWLLWLHGGCGHQAVVKVAG